MVFLLSDYLMDAVPPRGSSAHFIQATVVTHPRQCWWGAICRWSASKGVVVQWSRNLGLFRLANGAEVHGLMDRVLSRRPLVLRVSDQGLVFSGLSHPWRIHGMEQAGCVSWALLRGGVWLTVGDRVGLWLQLLQPDAQCAFSWWTHGSSHSHKMMMDFEHALVSTAGPVGLVGECGSGKQFIVRQALRSAPSGEARPLAFNPREICALDRQGEERAAEWLARFAKHVAKEMRVRSCCAMYLDAMSGLPKAHQCAVVDWAKRFAQNTHVFLAWDVVLDQSGGAWRESVASLSHVVALRPLRQRRSAIPRLIADFAKERDDPVAANDQRPWAASDFLHRLMRHPWPGNVNQLRAVILGLRFSRKGSTRWLVPPAVWRILNEPTGMVDAALAPSMRCVKT